jgi:hypothetical protein
MSDLSTKRLIAQYEEDAGAPGFGASFYQTTQADIHNSDTVEIDVRRDGRPISIALTDWKSGGRINTMDLYTNKSFVPPILKEVFVLNQGNLLGREFGMTPFENPDFMGRAQRTLRSGVAKMTAKIRRTLELQAWQIFKNGTVTLLDADGTTVYTIDFGMKSAHKTAATVDWDETSGVDILADLERMDDLARVNGKKGLDVFVFGDSAWGQFRKDETILKLLDNRRLELGGIAPKRLSEDQIFQGYLTLNGMRAELYTYKGSYDHPQTGADTRYVSAWDVIGIASNAPRRMTFGGIPRLVPPDQRVASLGLGALLAPGMGIAATTNAWVDAEGTSIYGSVATRPLAIPVAIDCHVCLNAKAT